MSERAVLRSTLACLLASLAAASGCQTIETFQDKEYEGSPIYSGTAKDLQYAGSGLLNLSLGNMMLGLADLPLSLVADTLLLPATIPRASARRAQQGERLRVDADRPSPVQAGTDEAPLAIARRLFEKCRELTESLDPAVADCYQVGARVHVSAPDGEPVMLSGAEYKEAIRKSIGRVRYRGDFITYREIGYALEGDTVRVSAQRATAFAPERVPASFLIARCADGQWRIVEESSPGWP